MRAWERAHEITFGLVPDLTYGSLTYSQVLDLVSSVSVGLGSSPYMCML